MRDLLACERFVCSCVHGVPCGVQIVFALGDKMPGCLDHKLAALTRPQRFGVDNCTSPAASCSNILTCYSQTGPERLALTRQYKEKQHSLLSGVVSDTWNVSCPARASESAPFGRSLLDSDPHGSQRAFSDAPSPSRPLGHRAALGLLDLGSALVNRRA